MDRPSGHRLPEAGEAIARPRQRPRDGEAGAQDHEAAGHTWGLAQAEHLEAGEGEAAQEVSLPIEGEEDTAREPGLGDGLFRQ